MKETEKIYRPHGRALGDCWADLNYFINYALENNEIINLSLWYRKGEKIKRADKIAEILPLLKYDHLIRLGEWDATENKIHWRLGGMYPFIPTKNIWKPNDSKKICYQFDGKSKKGQKNFTSPEIEQAIFDHAVSLGYELCKIGGNKSLAECVDDLSQSEFFMGIDSGMCYMAASVGIPVFLCQNKTPDSRIQNAHSSKHFVLSQNHEELKQQITTYNQDGIRFYLDNALNIELFSYFDCSDYHVNE